MPRDPRIDPRPGDVVRYAAGGATWTRTVVARHRRSVDYDRQSADGAEAMCGAASAGLSEWRACVWAAEVVRVGA